MTLRLMKEKTILTKVLATRTLGLILHLVVVEVDPGHIQTPPRGKHSQEERKNRSTTCQASKEGIVTTPEEGSGEPTPTSHLNSVTILKVPSPTTPEHANTPRIGTDDALHREYNLQTIITSF